MIKSKVLSDFPQGFQASWVQTQGIQRTQTSPKRAGLYPSFDEFQVAHDGGPKLRPARFKFGGSDYLGLLLIFSIFGIGTAISLRANILKGRRRAADHVGQHHRRTGSAVNVPSIVSEHHRSVRTLYEKPSPSCPVPGDGFSSRPEMGGTAGIASGSAGTGRLTSSPTAASSGDRGDGRAIPMRA